MTESSVWDDLGASIQTWLESYVHVNNVQVSPDTVRVGIDHDTHFYDSDATIGLLVRKFGLEYIDQNENEICDETFLHFRRPEEAEKP